ncbi:TPA: YlcG family protein [Klebsiella variicola subsp. variicola]|nr:YlcG family protein [Klebsiella variicola subsp. variicola]
MSRDVIERIRDRWWKLRLFRCRGTVMTDYRILKNFVRIYQSLENKHEPRINCKILRA